MNTYHHFTITLISSLLIALSSYSSADEAQKPNEKPVTEVILLPTIHSKHIKAKFYNIEQLKSVMREIKPDIVCTEITPQSLKANDEGKKDRRLSLFPEYTQAILPLREELKYEVIPCSAWTQKVNFRTVGVKKMDEAHYGLIAKALDRFQGQGKKVLITFGGGHINGLLEHLRLRKDIKIIDYRPTLNELQKSQAAPKP